LRDVRQPQHGASLRPWLYERSLRVSRRRLPQRKLLRPRHSQQQTLEVEVLRSGLHLRVEAAFRQHVDYWKNWRQNSGQFRDHLSCITVEHVPSLQVVGLLSERLLSAHGSEPRSGSKTPEVLISERMGEDLGTSRQHHDAGGCRRVAADVAARAPDAEVAGNALPGSLLDAAKQKAARPLLPGAVGSAWCKGQLPTLAAAPLPVPVDVQRHLPVVAVSPDAEAARSPPGKNRRRLLGTAPPLGQLRRLEASEAAAASGLEIPAAQSEATLPGVSRQSISSPLQIARDMTQQYLQHFEVEDLEDFLTNLATDQAASRHGAAGSNCSGKISPGDAQVACWPDFQWPGQPPAQGDAGGEEVHGAAKDRQSRGHTAATEGTTLPSLGLLSAGSALATSAASATSTAQSWRRMLETREGRGGTPLSSRASRRLEAGVAGDGSDRALTAPASARNPPSGVADVATKLPLLGGQAKARGLASVCHGLEQRMMFAEADPDTACVKPGSSTSAPSAPSAASAGQLKDMWVCGSERRYVPTRRRLKGL